VSNFEHVNFTINEKYSKSFYENPHYCVSLVIFQIYKNVILNNVHSLGWLLWLCFYPNVHTQNKDELRRIVNNGTKPMVGIKQIDWNNWNKKDGKIKANLFYTIERITTPNE
jgi:hypothetical protein